MFKHILVPTDGSPLSQDSVTRAVAFAKEAGAKLTFCHAEPPMPSAFGNLGGIGSATIGQEFHAKVDGRAQEILQAAEQVATEAGVPCARVLLVRSKPHEAIIEAATAQGCDLIFMASHGRRGVTALLLGSETQKVLTHSKIPVLVYR